MQLISSVRSGGFGACLCIATGLKTNPGLGMHLCNMVFYLTKNKQEAHPVMTNNAFAIYTNK